MKKLLPSTCHESILMSDLSDRGLAWPDDPQSLHFRRDGTEDHLYSASRANQPVDGSANLINSAE